MIPTPEGRAAVARDIASLMETVFSNMASRELIIQSATNKQTSTQCLDAANDAMAVAFGKLSAAMKRERNALIPAAALPPELLTRIFGLNDLRSTVVATAVCHRWRVTAISASWLWTYVDLDTSNMSEGMASLICERSRDMPIDLHLRLIIHRHWPSNSGLPISLTGLLPRVRSISNLAVDDWMLQYMGYTPTPRLESCHLLLGGRPLHSFLKQHTCLSHLSLEFPGTQETSGAFHILRLSDAKDTLLGLRVLHLHNVRISASELHMIVELTPNIEELAVNDCISSESDYHMPLDASHCLRRLRILSLLRCSAVFAASFLHNQGPIKVRSTTHVQLGIDTYKTPSTWPLQREAHPNTRLHILEKGKVFFYETDQSLTRIVYTKVSPIASFPVVNGQLVRLVAFPEYIDPSTIEMLAIHRLVRVNSESLYTLTHLKELHIDFQPVSVNEPDPGLSIILNHGLAASCPQLHHIMIRFLKSHVHDVTQEQKPEDDLSVFLDAWLELHRRVFPSVHIHDRIQPSRWNEYVDVFRGLTGEFIVDDRRPTCTLPKFPSLTQFIPDGSRRQPLSFRNDYV